MSDTGLGVERRIVGHIETQRWFLTFEGNMCPFILSIRTETKRMRTGAQIEPPPHRPAANWAPRNAGGKRPDMPSAALRLQILPAHHAADLLDIHHHTLVAEGHNRLWTRFGSTR